MREKDYNTGLRGVLFEAQHHARMGAAIWLYGWLVLRQTHQTGTTGWVLGGAPISYREIEEETGFNRRTLERWMRLLRKHEYISTALRAGRRDCTDFESEETRTWQRRLATGARCCGGCTQEMRGPGRRIA